MVVETYKIGNTTIEIHDDAIVATQEEVNSILDRISKLAD